MALPQDPMILLSWVNTQLRDHYPSLAALCDDQDVSQDELVSKLNQLNFQYSPKHNRFL